MDWKKRIAPSGGQAGGWRDDFPLDTELPPRLELDLSRLGEPIHPMFAVRLAVFMDWHRRAGRQILLTPPETTRAAALIAALLDEHGSREHLEVVLPVTRFSEFNEVEELSARVLDRLEYKFTDVSTAGQPAFQAVSEFGQNAVEHGANDAGAYVAVSRAPDDQQPCVWIALADLGIGIPGHVRHIHPEWADDGFAIAQATDEAVSGTGKKHRGYGFPTVFEEVLTKSVQTAQIDVLASRGFFRMRLANGAKRPETFPAAQYRHGTWITCEIVGIPTG